jgi:hypothetical protein
MWAGRKTSPSGASPLSTPSASSRVTSSWPSELSDSIEALTAIDADRLAACGWLSRKRGCKAYIRCHRAGPMERWQMDIVGWVLLAAGLEVASRSLCGSGLLSCRTGVSQRRLVRGPRAAAAWLSARTPQRGTAPIPVSAGNPSVGGPRRYLAHSPTSDSNGTSAQLHRQISR